MKKKYTQDEVWQYMREKNQGRIYFNKDDANIFVKRKPGYLQVQSWTMNFANKRTYLVLLAQLLIACVVIVLIINCI